jgi:hypothetical protein
VLTDVEVVDAVPEDVVAELEPELDLTGTQIEPIDGLSYAYVYLRGNGSKTKTVCGALKSADGNSYQPSSGGEEAELTFTWTGKKWK